MITTGLIKIVTPQKHQINKAKGEEEKQKTNQNYSFFYSSLFHRKL